MITTNKKNFYELFFLILCLLSGCATTPPPQSEVTDPIHGQEASDAVFKIAVLAPRPLLTIPREKYDQILKAAEHGDFMDYLYGDRVQECKKNHAKSCSIYFSGFATAFIAGDSSTVWTVRHVFDPVMEEIKIETTKGKKKKKSRARTPWDEYQQLIANAKPEFILFDRFKNAVYDTRKPADGAHFLFIGNAKLMQEYAFAEFLQFATQSSTQMHLRRWQEEFSLGVTGKLTDFAKIKLNRAIPTQPLAFAAEMPEQEDAIYLIGYPNRTERDTPYTKKYYDGHSQQVSSGQVSSAFQMFHQISEIHQITPDDNHALFQLFEKYFFYHNAPSAEGFSGGPIVNEEGNVISIQSSGSENGGFGLLPGWMKILETQFSNTAENTHGSRIAPTIN